MDYDERLHRIKSWQQTEEYAQQYISFLYIVNRLISFAEQQLPEIKRIAEEIHIQTVRTVAATNSSMHRGFYCPSPIDDLVVGNIKRGSLLKRLTSRSKSYFLYGFDAYNRLIWNKHFFNNCHIKTEYLFHIDGNIYGITIDLYGRLEAITEEVYADNHLICYRYMLVASGGDGIDPVELRQEEYEYDSDGLLYCDWYTLHPAISLLKHEKVTFTRENGYLKQYWVERIIGSTHEEVINKSNTFYVLIERKA